LHWWVERQIKGWLYTKAFNFRTMELRGLKKVCEGAQPMYVNTRSVFLRIYSFVSEAKKAWLGLKGSFSMTKRRKISFFITVAIAYNVVYNKSQIRNASADRNVI
jgi:hypothetical protein